MRKLPVAKFLTGLIILLMLFFSLVPAIAEAKAGDEDEIVDPTAVHSSKAGDEDEGTDSPVMSRAGDEDEISDSLAMNKAGDEDELTPSPVVYFQEGEGEEGGEVESLAGTGIALGVIALILVLLAVVAVIGAASLGIIGLGYWQSQGSGD